MRMRPASYDLPWPPNADVARFRARAFASTAPDLDLDFDRLPAQKLITELLSRCLHDSAGGLQASETLWHWSVGERLQGLLAITQASQGAAVPALAHCSAPACSGRIELELVLARFANERSESTGYVECATSEGTRLCLRLPTGADLLAWHDTGANDEAWLARSLILSADDVPFCVDSVLPDAWLAPISAALSGADPLTALTVEVACPYCGRVLPVELDLEPLLLDALRRVQRTALEEVHRLARVYHWTEAQIIAMPAWRRRRYLARNEAEFA